MSSRATVLAALSLVAFACAEPSATPSSPAASGGAAGSLGSSGSAGDAAGAAEVGGSPGAGASGASGAGGAGQGGSAHELPETKCKRGLGVNDVSLSDLQALSAATKWFYDWGTALPASLQSSPVLADFEFVPMVWGGDPDVATTASQIPAGAKYLLAFNEPNFRSQGNLPASEAAALWPKLEQIADARGLKIVGPAVNFCGPESECWDTDPFSYLDEFLAACPGCRVDHLAVHWYACDGPGLEWYLGEAKKYGKPLWLTEFNCPGGDAAAQLAYMKVALPLLEAEPMVFRYSWFMARSTVPEINLLASDGELTALGQEYVDAAVAAECEQGR